MPGQREQTERDHGRADNAGRGAEQHADEHDADAEAAAHRARQMPDHLHQVFRELRLFQHHAHEHEQRNGEQSRIGDDAENAAGKQIEQQAAEAEIPEDKTRGRQCQPDGNARQQQHEKRCQHQDGENFQITHQTLRIAIQLLIACDSDCRKRMAKPAGISALTI